MKAPVGIQPFSEAQKRWWQHTSVKNARLEIRSPRTPKELSGINENSMSRSTVIRLQNLKGQEERRKQTSSRGHAGRTEPVRPATWDHHYSIPLGVLSEVCQVAWVFSLQGRVLGLFPTKTEGFNLPEALGQFLPPIGESEKC